ncbi:GTPase [bacterium]|nr:MAG: GTPase [bacterium]
MRRRKVIIMGAAGRDFHNFNTFFRDNDDFEVIAFTATQIPDIEGRTYPPELTGKLYPDGIPIVDEAELVSLIKDKNVDEVYFSYSDVSNQYVMERGAVAMAAGASYCLLGPKETMIESKKPVISICAVRTGSGKSQTTRRVAEILKDMGKKVAVIRHPMPYGDLRKQIWQRFATYEDLDKYDCTIEEREEYEPHIDRGNVVYAGVDYGEILRRAEEEADIILWDGGNNDLPFYRSDLHIVVADPLRPGDEVEYYPGNVNLVMADVIVINKVDTANYDDVRFVMENIRKFNPDAKIITAASPIYLEEPDVIYGKKVLVVEDGPTLTHGGMSYGAGFIAAQMAGATEIIDPRPFAKGSILKTYQKYPTTGDVLPAMGYSHTQIKELEETINSSDAEAVVIGTPIDLRRVIKIDKPATRVRYELMELSKPTLEDIIKNIPKFN